MSAYKCSFRIYIIFYHRRPFNKTAATLVRPHPFSTLCTTPLGKMTLWGFHTPKIIFLICSAPLPSVCPWKAARKMSFTTRDLAGLGTWPNPAWYIVINYSDWLMSLDFVFTDWECHRVCASDGRIWRHFLLWWRGPQLWSERSVVWAGRNVWRGQWDAGPVRQRPGHQQGGGHQQEHHHRGHPGSGAEAVHTPLQQGQTQLWKLWLWNTWWASPNTEQWQLSGTVIITINYGCKYNLDCG